MRAGSTGGWQAYALARTCKGRQGCLADRAGVDVGNAEVEGQSGARLHRRALEERGRWGFQIHQIPYMQLYATTHKQNDQNSPLLSRCLTQPGGDATLHRFIKLPCELSDL